MALGWDLIDSLLIFVRGQIAAVNITDCLDFSTGTPKDGLLTVDEVSRTLDAWKTEILADGDPQALLANDKDFGWVKKVLLMLRAVGPGAAVGQRRTGSTRLCSGAEVRYLSTWLTPAQKTALVDDFKLNVDDLKPRDAPTWLPRFQQVKRAGRNRGTLTSGSSFGPPLGVWFCPEDAILTHNVAHPVTGLFVPELYRDAVGMIHWDPSKVYVIATFDAAVLDVPEAWRPTFAHASYNARFMQTPDAGMSSRGWAWGRTAHLGRSNNAAAMIDGVPERVTARFLGTTAAPIPFEFDLLAPGFAAVDFQATDPAPPTSYDEKFLAKLLNRPGRPALSVGALRTMLDAIP